MGDDDRLLELLSRALDPGDLEPPVERVAALRIQAAAWRERESAAPLVGASAASAPPPVAGPGPAGAGPPPPLPFRRPEPAPVSPFRSHRAGWLAASAAVAAAVLIVALIAVPALLRDRGGETSVAVGGSASARDAVTRLRAALVSRDPLTVARADAELVRVARQLPPAERAELENEAVSTHVEAIQFLRGHPTPEVLAVVPDGASAEPAPSTTVVAEVPPVPGSVPPDDVPVTTTVAPPVPTTVVTTPPSVAITEVTPTLNGTFAVDFTVTGFNPDLKPRAGARAIRFSFDDGQQPELWDGPSPWTFPVDNAIRFHQLCAVVVDGHGLELPDSGNCVPIL